MGSFWVECPFADCMADGEPLDAEGYKEGERFLWTCERCQKKTWFRWEQGIDVYNEYYDEDALDMEGEQ